MSCLVLLACLLKAQNYVSTEPTNKNVVLELFTGVGCLNCPEGHAMISEIISEHPGRVFCTGYHPSNSSYTIPYPGDIDLRRDYPNEFYSIPYCGASRFMPGAFINRIIWDNGDRLQSSDLWENYTSTLLNEPSPLNIGLASSYDQLSQVIHITVELYYTESMPDQNNVYVILSENDLVTQQSGVVGPYTHKHTFRESFCAQWGDQVQGPTAQNSLITLDYDWDASGQDYIPGNCELIVFVENQASGEIINGVGTNFGSATYIPPTAGFIVDKPYVAVGSVAVFRDVSTGGPTIWEWSFEGGVPATSGEQSPAPVQYKDPGKYDVILKVSNPAGVDTLEIQEFVKVGYAPVSGFIADSALILAGQKVDFTDLTLHDPTSWYWEFPGGEPASSHDKDPGGIRYDEQGIYDVKLTTSNSYGTDVIVIEGYIVVSALGMKDITEYPGIVIYPNPCDGLLHIDIGNLTGVQIIYVRDIKGNIINAKDPEGANINSFDLGMTSSGIYLVEIQTTKQRILRKVFIR
ncbi:MAG TPA: Omp28-related outer membrane protein [Bacteroidales bacterium]|nr:Omp28-related outer membrane protein [Bacteroidales bacterium]